MADPADDVADVLGKLGVPPEITAALVRLRDGLAQAAGKNLAGLILYGGLARGRFRPGQSDVNVVVLLHDMAADQLKAIMAPLRVARRSIGVEPLLLIPREVHQAADVFPTKFLDIKEHHVVLAGEDPFASLTVEPEHIRLRVEQTLRNLTLRLRRRYVALGDDADELARALVGIARPLALELGALLRLSGKELPAQDRTSALLAEAASAFGLDAQALADLSALRQNPQANRETPALYQRVLATIAHASDLAEQVKLR
jgi:hypothetical protein